MIMAWRRPRDKPLSEPMMVYLLMHICVTRPQWLMQRIFNISLSFFNDSWWISYSLSAKANNGVSFVRSEYYLYSACASIVLYATPKRSTGVTPSRFSIRVWQNTRNITKHLKYHGSVKIYWAYTEPNMNGDRRADVRTGTRKNITDYDNSLRPDVSPG